MTLSDRRCSTMNSRSEGSQSKSTSNRSSSFFASSLSSSTHSSSINMSRPFVAQWGILGCGCKSIPFESEMCQSHYSPDQGSRPSLSTTLVDFLPHATSQTSPMPSQPSVPDPSPKHKSLSKSGVQMGRRDKLRGWSISNRKHMEVIKRL